MKNCYKIIVVEDEAPIRRSLCKKIEESTDDFIISGIFKNGKHALDSIGSDLPDLVITDIKMPIMDGLELAREIKRLSRFCEVVIVSGFSDFEYAREAIKYQVTEYLTKPLIKDDLIRVLEQVKQNLDERDPVYDQKAEDLMRSSSGRVLTDAVCNYLKDHFSENITIADVCRHFDFGAEHLSRTFKKEMGISPQHYLIDLRINRACEVLIHYDELDIKSVGELAGYPDPYYFSRIFKKYTRLSPKEYRKQHLIKGSS